MKIWLIILSTLMLVGCQYVDRIPHKFMDREIVCMRLTGEPAMVLFYYDDAYMVRAYKASSLRARLSNGEYADFFEDELERCP